MSLPPAIPPFKADPQVLARLLGEAHAYIAQLHAEMERRAIEANDLHDQNAALRARLVAAQQAEQQEPEEAG
ncbi:hypothetical protein [Streptomyces sp. NPDC093261]|uniref:hypothetical protein n=1 Tax=Streptomyces sp. NPDC093261 TaxID=3366037 RepID=UPI0038282019